MSLLTILSYRIFRNSLRARIIGQNNNFVFATAFTHSKVELFTPNAKIVKTITRKNVGELPVCRKLPDGSNAPALDEWSGGLKVPNKFMDITPETCPEDLRSGTDFTFEGDRLERPKKRRKTKGTDDTHLAKVDMVSPEIILLKKNRRGRPKTVKANQIQESSRGSFKNSEISLSPGDVCITVEKPPVTLKRRLKKAEEANPSFLDIKDSGSSRKAHGNLTTVKISRSTRPRRISKNGGLATGGEPHMPQNQLATEILENLAKFPHCILLTRVGNFYESYFDQAADVAQLLSIKLTKRTWDGQEVLMCGFPIVHLDRHLKVLVQMHKRCVAMCEEFKRTHSEEGFERRVVRVLTPGTLIDEPFLNPYENNYLLAVGNMLSESQDEACEGGSVTADSLNSSHALQVSLGLAWIDVSTGEFFAQQSNLGSLKDDLARIGPREIVLHTSLKEQESHPIRLAVADEGGFVSYISPHTVPSLRTDLTPFADGEGLISMTLFPRPSTPAFTEYESSAINLLTTFLQTNLLEHMPLLSPPAQQGPQDRMQIDSQTIKALEVRESMREGGVTGSLMSVIKRTVTTGGTRLLARWLCAPSISITEIHARQSLVALFCSRPHLRDDLTHLLRQIEDASRIVQRFLLGKGDVEDLSAIKNAIEIWAEIKSRAETESRLKAPSNTENETREWAALHGLLHKLADLRGLAQRIGMAVADREQNIPSLEERNTSETLGIIHTALRLGPVDKENASRRWTIKPDFSPELSSLHVRLKEAEAEKQRLEETLRRRYQAPSLTLRSSGSHGVHVHIGNSRRDLTDIDRSRYFIPLGSSGSTKSFFHQAWYLLGTRTIEITLQILAAERNIFERLRREVNAEIGSLRRNAGIIDELDVTLGFANLASEMKFVRPVLNESSSYLVTNGRHPSVELGLLTSGRMFTPNSISLNPENRVHIITGPNMAGKSTLLRQTAILAILAQIGSFVPADKAEIGIVDKLFSRVGAKDDLFRDRSTFMVEMLETAEILNRATEKSLVIMDEVGRGTTVKDGLAIAFATVCHLYNVNRCRTLFATHFHEVADMLGYEEGSSSSGAFKDIGFFCTNVDEIEDDRFVYSHRLRPGVNRDSHGLKVAKLAGMPPSALRLAHETLYWMKARQGSWLADKVQLRLAGEVMVRRNDEALRSNL